MYRTRQTEDSPNYTTYLYRASWKYKSTTGTDISISKPRYRNKEHFDQQRTRTSVGVRFVDRFGQLIFGAGRGEAAADEIQNALLHSVVVSHRSFWWMNLASSLVNFSSQMEWQELLTQVAMQHLKLRKRKSRMLGAWACLSNSLFIQLPQLGGAAVLLCKLKIFLTNDQRKIHLVSQ
jgi:hypothetical protein